MSAYVLSVIGTILLCAILTAILPNGKTNAVIKGVARLACVISIVMPVLIFFQSGEWSVGKIFFEEDFSKTVIQTDREFIKYYSEMRVRETQQILQEELLKEFSVKSAVKISWNMENGEYAERYEEYKIKITQIHVENQEKQTEEVERAMWIYLTENYCSEVLIE